jgi:hypothetical protein
MANVIVCGGRDFDNWRLLDETLQNSLELDDVIIQGGAKGADFLARVWAKYVGLKSIEFPADWKTHGKAAGAIRNQQMLDETSPVAVIAFPGGRGTADMISRAKKAGITVHEIKEA